MCQPWDSWSPNNWQKNIETDYNSGDIIIQFFSQIYTEEYEGEITTGSRTTESVDSANAKTMMRQWADSF